MELIDHLWEGVSEALYISKEQYAESLKDWKIDPVEIDGELAFITAVKGSEFHFASLNTGKHMPGKRLRAFVQGIIDEYGYADTKTPRDDVKQQRFNTFLGFEIAGEDALDIHFRITELRRATVQGV